MTTPTQVLSDEQIEEIVLRHMEWYEIADPMALARAIEAAVLASIAQPVAVYPQGVMGIPPYSPPGHGSTTVKPGISHNATAPAQPSVVPERFDEWIANPYTKTLMASIESDYVPKYNVPTQPCGDAEQADAERYRKLRAGNDYAVDGPMVVLYEKQSDDGGRPYWSLSGEALDDAVDRRESTPSIGEDAANEAPAVPAQSAGVALATKVWQDTAHLRGEAPWPNAALTAEKVAQAEPDIKALVNRFLAWPLPQTVAADGCATNSAYAFPRSGTNLLNADEAEAMLRYVLTALQPAQTQVALDDNSRGILSDALGMYARKHGMAPSQRQAIELMLDRLAI